MNRRAAPAYNGLVQPFIVDPHAYDKETAFLDAVMYVYAFLDANGVKHPKEILFEADVTKKPPGKNPWHNNGWYWQDTIFVNVKKSKVPVKTPGFSWSFTGFKADLTAPGILAHEVGHYVHEHWETVFPLTKQQLEVIRDDIEDIAKKEAPVSGYEPNYREVFAETARLFILNPTLLKEGRKLRYNFIHDFMGFRPLHDVPWRDVLKNAHPKIISAAENWVKR